MPTHTKKDLLKFILGAAALFIFFYFISSIDQGLLERIATRLGWWGLLFFFFVTICAHVFAPISSTPFYFVAIKLYGYEAVLVLFYLAAMASAIICFYISRKWGRGLVIKLVGSKSMAHIDRATLTHEKTLLITGRALGYFFFEFVSYALGFTKVSFRRYMWYTAIATLIPTAILYFVFKDLDFNSFLGLSIYYGSIVLTGIIFTHVFVKILKTQD